MQIIVGAGGYIGSYLLNSSSDFGEQVITFSGRSQFSADLNDLSSRDTRNAKVVWCVNTFNEKNPTGPLENLEMNYLSRFLDVIRESSQGSAHVTFLSSGGAVYGQSDIAFEETSILNPWTEYGRNKIRLENLVIGSEMKYTILRLGNVYGPNPENQFGVIADWTRKVNFNEKLRLFGSLNSFRDYVHIVDVIRAIRAAQNQKVSMTLNIGSGVPTSLSALLNVFQSSMKRTLDFELLNSRNTDAYGYFLSINKAKYELDWFPEVSLIDGISEIVTS